MIFPFGEFFPLADGGDESSFALLKAVAFIAFFAISFIGSLVSHFLKRKKSDDGVPEIDESVFENAEEEDAAAGTPEAWAKGGDGTVETALEKMLREHRAEIHARLLRQAAEKPAQNPADAGEAAETRPAKSVAVPVPRKKILEKKRISAETDANELFPDRAALRRAVLAQEILSPPLALRE